MGCPAAGASSTTRSARSAVDRQRAAHVRHRGAQRIRSTAGPWWACPRCAPSSTTVDVVHGGFVGGADPLPDNSVQTIEKIQQGAAIYNARRRTTGSPPGRWTGPRRRRARAGQHLQGHLFVFRRGGTHGGGLARPHRHGRRGRHHHAAVLQLRTLRRIDQLTRWRAPHRLGAWRASALAIAGASGPQGRGLHRFRVPEGPGRPAARGSGRVRMVPMQEAAGIPHYLHGAPGAGPGRNTATRRWTSQGATRASKGMFVYAGRNARCRQPQTALIAAGALRLPISFAVHQ